MAVAFHAWNPFQVFQIREIAKNYEDSVILFERRKAMDFDRVFDSTILTDVGVPVHEVSTLDLARIDGKYDAVVIQTPYRHVEQLEKTKLVAAQYSITKERHQHGSWRALCDLNLVYGAYSFERVKNFAPAAIVGNPRFDPWFHGTLDHEKIVKIRSVLDPRKKTVLYAPTWGDISSVPLFKDAVAQLAAEYNLLVKVHHNTDTLELERKDSIQAAGASALFGASDDSLYLLACADLVISDYSGAIFDAINVGKPVVLLQHEPEKLSKDKFGLESIEYARRGEIGLVASNPAEVRDIVAGAISHPLLFSAANEKLRDECFGQQRGCGLAAAAAITDLLRGKFQRPPYQEYLRDDLRRSRLEAEELKKLKRSKNSGGAESSAAFLGDKGATPPAAAGSARKARSLRQFFFATTAEVTRQLFRASVAVSPQFARRWGQHLGADRLVKASKEFALCGHNAPALLAAKIGAERKWTARAHYLTISMRQGYMEGVEYLWKTRRFGSGRGWAITAITAIRSGHLLGEDLHQIGAFKRDAINVLALRKGTPTARVERATALIKLREIDKARNLLNQSGRSKKVLRLQDQVSSLMDRSKEWFPLVRLATKNELSVNRFEFFGLYHGREVRVGEIRNAKIVEFHIGTYFGTLITKSDAAAHARICTFQRGVLKALSDRGFLIVPKHQYWLNIARPSGYWPAISYHTTGDSDDWLHLKDSALPDLYRFDARGYAGWSELALMESLPSYVNDVPQSQIDAAWDATRHEVIDQKKTKYEQVSSEFDLPGRPYFFFPLQLIDDTVAQLAWIPMLKAVEIVRQVARRRGMMLVVKRHPLCRRKDVKKFLDRLSRDKDVVETSAPIFDIIENARAVVTVNSGVGFEAILRGSRVITVGSSEYRMMAVAAKTPKELEVALLEDGDPATLEEVKKFVWLYRSRCVSGDSFEPIVEWANQAWEGRRAALIAA